MIYSPANKFISIIYKPFLLVVLCFHFSLVQAQSLAESNPDLHAELVQMVGDQSISYQPEPAVANAAEAGQQLADPEYLNPNPRAPYSEGVRYGGLIFLAGKTGGSGESGVQPETRRSL